MEFGECSSSIPPQAKRQRRNPFIKIKPFPCSTSSAVIKKRAWDVFINHRGCDTKHTLASIIYHTLEMNNIHAFLDAEELELGESLPVEIQEAIQTAGLHIAIFSERYAESACCLAELCYMLQTGTPIIPVFYQVDPSDLRSAAQGKGCYAPAFSQHEEKDRYSSNMLHDWKMALQLVSNFFGYVLKKKGDEGMLLKSIVNFGLRTLREEPLEIVKRPVGMDEIVQEFERSQQEYVDIEQGVQIVGIVGLGGSGKTALAKEIYNRKSSSINHSSFLHDLRDAASRNVMLNKQKKLLDDVRIKTEPFDNVKKGKAIIADRLKSLTLLIVLDDVDHEDQLDALLPPKQSLGRGSLVIITTREVDVLLKWGITSIFKMRPLQDLPAKELFCWHAFSQPHPQKGFEDLVESFVNSCSGLPFSLKVIGEQLYGKMSREYWVSRLKTIQRILPNEILERLKVSYDALDAEEKEIFLDIACFLIGERRSMAIDVWNATGWNGLCIWEALQNKCLVEVDREERIMMHDHLRDLGRLIAKTHSPLRIQMEKGIPFRGITDTEERRVKFESRWGEAIESTEKCAELLRGLLWLEWWKFKDASVPSWLPMDTIIVLEFYDPESLEILWEDARPPLQLRELRIIQAHRLQRLPKSIGSLQYLKRLSLECDSKLSSLPEEFCQLQLLEHLVLRGCHALSSLPNRFGDLVNLLHLDLSYCRRLKRLPESFKQLILLEYLNLDGCVSLESLNNIPNHKAVMHDHLRDLGRQISPSPQRIQRILPNEILERLSYDALDTEKQEVEKDMLSSSTVTQIQIPYYPASKTTEPWDIFINHCGSDVKDTLATTIHDKLHSMGLRVYPLNKHPLHGTDSFPATATIHIAIFDPNYAQSPRCLTELSVMLKTCAKIIPIYYYVEPADLKWIYQGKGRYATAFSQHEKRGMYSKEKLDEWKSALHRISFLPNHLISDSKDQQGVVEYLVDLVLQCPALKSAGTIQIVGICGMGGSGKTTLVKEAKKIYENRSMFSRSSFLYNIRDATEKELLLEKQKKLLCDLDVNGVSSDDIDAGKEILNSQLQSTSVLIILDDVDNTDQLDALLPGKENLGQGSLIIVTTRKPHVLKARDISTIYQMRGLEAIDAKQLFCRHAFRQPFPLSGFETLVERFLMVCNGLPLSLKVLGGMLFGETCKDRWKHILKELPTVSDSDITEQLRICFDALDGEDKKMFLDVACFFIGEEKSLAIEVWEGSGWDAQIGLDRLLTKCLVEVDDHDIIQMHDDLRDLGREIANQQSPYRLWSPQLVPIQESFQNIRGMTNTVSNADDHWKNKETQSSLLGLKLLVCSAQFLNEEVSELSRELLWLRWNDFNHTNLPPWLSLKNLRVLELNGALNLQELWTDIEHAPLQLRELIIAGTWSASFEKFPNSISNLKHLKKIALLGGISKEFSIKELPEEFCDLQSLEHLELRHCTFLSTLPTHFGKLRKLRHLDLYSCQMLRKLPSSFKQMVNLEYLDLSDCKKLPSVPDIFENMRKLKKLYFTGCRKLQELPLQIADQKDLTELHLKKTTLKYVPDNIGELSKLEKLVIGSPHLTGFPESFRYMSSLIHLEIAGCINLNSFPDSVKHLKLLEYLCIKSCGLRSLPHGVKQLSNLQILKIFDCPIGKLDVGTGSFSSLPKLKVIHLKATDVTRLSISEDCCPCLETLHLELNRRLIEIDIFSTSVRMMKVSECSMLRNINGISGLIKLETMEMTRCPKLAHLRSAASTNF